MTSSSKNAESPTDMNERRKAQNRAAQKKYRTRQKMRLELARAILLDRQHFRLEDRVEWPVPTENDIVQARLSRHNSPAHTPKMNSVDSVVAAAKHQLANQENLQTRSEVTDSIEVALDTPDMAFDLELDHELSLSDFGTSPVHSPINTDCIDTDLTQLDWINESNIRGLGTTLPSPAATPLLEELKSIHVSEAQDTATVSSPWPTMPLATPASLSQPPATHLRPETPSSTDSTGARRQDHAQSSQVSRSNSPGLNVGSESSSPLFTAISLGNFEMARMLVAAGAKIDVPDTHGNTALHQCIQRGDINATRTLLDLGASILKTNSSGLGSLHMAVEAGNGEMVRAILDRCTRNEEGSARKDNQTGTNSLRRCIDARDARNMTAIHLSVTLQRMEIFRILLDYGADVNIGCD
ncbi:ankyrin repeat-containing domain protein [Xylariaceae sp. FL1651]|nr:ankyrin repeat-containing domain protein [Xylariaceae sp. FL1651]